MLTNEDKQYLIESVLNEISGPAMMKLIKNFSRELMQTHGRQFFNVADTPLEKILKNRDESRSLAILMRQLKAKYPNLSADGLKRIIRKHYPNKFPQYTQMLKNQAQSIASDVPINSQFTDLKKIRAGLTPDDVKMMVFGNSRIPR